ncbi:MAG: peptidoglycan DD-metalloendopeptidase family protein [Burkholderiales bacterium]|nr:peptidoglycan DD-metalloendopeptidase family protein [Burkholderiales bacterium]
MSGLLRRGSLLLAVAGVLALSGCGSKLLNHAPVEDRGSMGTAPVVGDARTQPVKQLPGFENAGKPGYYTVKPGDTLIRIGLETGQSHKDISRWNALDNPNRIEVGQVIRVAPPAGSDVPAVVVAKPVASSSVVSTPIAASVPTRPVSAPSSAPVAAPAPVAATTTPAATGDDNLGWIWPGNGHVLTGFDEVKNKGLDIAGASGDPVVAAAEGKVVYAGSGLRGYGNLIILKHNNTYLTAYAHNKSLLVKEDQTVKKGQKIAEMGDSDADRVKLHFEVRRQGKPVDPAKYLPAR